jgi:hypothetical protein
MGFGELKEWVLGKFPPAPLYKGGQFEGNAEKGLLGSSSFSSN